MVKRIQVCTVKGSFFVLRGYNKEKAKKLLGHLKTQNIFTLLIVQCTQVSIVANGPLVGDVHL